MDTKCILCLNKCFCINLICGHDICSLCMVLLTNSFCPQCNKYIKINILIINQEDKIAEHIISIGKEKYRHHTSNHIFDTHDFVCKIKYDIIACVKSGVSEYSELIRIIDQAFLTIELSHKYIVYIAEQLVKGFNIRPIEHINVTNTVISLIIDEIKNNTETLGSINNMSELRSWSELVYDQMIKNTSWLGKIRSL